MVGIRRTRSFTMDTSSDVTIQVLVFSLVAAAFTTVYITQPVLPVIQDEFAVDARTASLSVSMVIFGIALANLPFGILADRYPIKPLLLTGGTVITATSLVCAATQSIAIPLRRALHTGTFHPVTDHVPCRLFGEEFTRITSQRGDGFLCISDRSGRDGRPVAGWLDPSAFALALRFVSASVLLITATIAASRWLPVQKEEPKPEFQQAGFIQLLAQPSLWRVLVVAFSAYFVFSAMFNYLPFYPQGRRFRRVPRSSHSCIWHT